MLSRSGFSIRRLISTHRPRRNSEGSGIGLEEEPSAGSPSSPRRPSRWSETASSRRSGPKSPGSPRSSRTLGGKSVRRASKTKKSLQPIVVMGRSGSVHRIGSLPPLPDTPHSLASSLCSCDNHGSPLLAGAGSGSPRLCSTRSKTPDADHALCFLPPPPPSPPVSISSNTADHHPTNNHSSQCACRHSKSMSFLYDPTDSVPELSLLEGRPSQHERAQADPHQDGQRSPKRLIADDASVDGMSENVRQLIRETDEAFKAVGNVISEAKIVSQSFSISASPSMQPGSEASPASPRPQTQSPRTAGLRRDLKSVSPWKTPTRKVSVTKAKRRKSKNGRRRDTQQPQPQQSQPQPQRKASPVSSKGGPRWTLPENVSGLLNGRLFHRIEADEMLTPTQLQEWKQTRMTRMQANRSTDTLRTSETDESETPIEPFHLEDLPTRIGAAGVRLSIPSPIAEVPTPRSFDFGLDAVETKEQDDVEVTVGKDEAETKVDTEEEQEQREEEASAPTPLPSQVDGTDAMTFHNMSFPAPPQKSPLRLTPRRQLPPLPTSLPTIPEVMVTSPDGASAQEDKEESKQGQGQRQQEMRERGHGGEDDDFVFFLSTPYTITMPTYRHGPIRFSKADTHLRDAKQLVPDETLDWTAFQMAILGGAGDFFSDSVDFTRLADADEVDELAVWFEGFGFAHAGRLVDAGDEHDQADIKKVSTKSKSTGRNGDKKRQPRAAAADKKRPKPLVDTQAAASPPTVNSPPSPANAADYSPVSSCGSSTASATADAAPQPNNEERQLEMVQIQSLPIPLALEYPTTGFWQIGQQATGGLAGGLGIRRWTAEGHPKKYLGTGGDNERARKTSSDSGPPSPMLELVVNRGIDGDEYLVPMGYNLGHDLGDFLKWESQNVYAAGFFGSD